MQQANILHFHADVCSGLEGNDVQINGELGYATEPFEHAKRTVLVVARLDLF